MVISRVLVIGIDSPSLLLGSDSRCRRRPNASSILLLLKILPFLKTAFYRVWGLLFLKILAVATASSFPSDEHSPQAKPSHRSCSDRYSPLDHTYHPLTFPCYYGDHSQVRCHERSSKSFWLLLGSSGRTITHADIACSEMEKQEI